MSCNTKTGLPLYKKERACKTVNWKKNEQYRYNYDTYSFNFMDCLTIENDDNFNYITLPTGLYLYHGSPAIGKLISEKGIDPLWPVGAQSALEESWYSSYPIAHLYSENNILVYTVYNKPKMFILNDKYNLLKLLKTYHYAFPKKLNEKEKLIKIYFYLFLRYALWIQTGKGGTLQTWEEHRVSQFILDPPETRYILALDRYGSRWLEQQFSKFFCGWLGDKYGYAGYISDEVYTTDPRLIQNTHNCFFHPEVMFCYAPSYLKRMNADPIDAATKNPNLMMIEYQVPLKTPEEYIKFYLSIKDNPKIDPQIKQKWLMRMLSLYMPKFDLNANKFIHICTSENGTDLDTYRTAIERNDEFRKIDTNFPDVWRINHETHTEGSLDFLNNLCQRIKVIESCMIIS